MKRKTVYKWMGVIVGLSIVLYAAIYFLNLGDEANKMANSVKNGPPSFSYFVQGDFKTPLDKPMDVTKVGEFIYVTDTNNKQVQAFDGSGTPIFKFGKEGEGKGEFKFPYGIAGDKDGNIYVADLFNGKISIFDNKGKFLRYFEEKDSSTSSIKSPAGLRIFGNKLYITDIENKKVLVFDLDGKKILEITTATSKEDLLNAPNAVTIDNQNNIYVADSGNQRVVVYDKNGNYKLSINGSKDGKGDPKFVNPRGLAVGSDGILYLIDNMTHFVYGYDSKGEQVYQFGGLGSENNQFFLPNGLFIDEKSQIYITDTFNQRIAVYF
ncbi:6-bladed beta-propeller [Bacillus sp. B-jedd]|uniref:6-bladed beta-propeller n=1 Tax=Bacillus sp. B-jedd TaxID=1476857 RepID=UPI0005156B1A|nr:6-bladed beta-propeller [Bacillus sp. B-jedd]CEG29060.1 Serine/threonine-protein kinase PknD [Bacillus sp. B-jedd]